MVNLVKSPKYLDIWRCPRRVPPVIFHFFVGFPMKIQRFLGDSLIRLWRLQETILTKGLPEKAPNGTGQLLPVDYTAPKAQTATVDAMDHPPDASPLR